MSKSYVSLAGQTTWYSDEPFAVWLRLMALNIQKNVRGSSGRIIEVTDEWLRTSRLLGVSNVMGVDLDDDFPTYEMACLLRDAVGNLNELLVELNDVTLDQLVRTSGFAASCSVTDLLEIGQDVDVRIQFRLSQLKPHESSGTTPEAT
jgi:hypothetical protein